MIFGQDRDELRRMYRDAWQKHGEHRALSPLEAQIVQVVAEHPEYHAALAGDLTQGFGVAASRSNPFLHMGLHLGIRDQVAMDRPVGIATVYQALVRDCGDPHRAEHRMMDCLAETLWEAQGRGQPPDELHYLQRLRQL